MPIVTSHSAKTSTRSSTSVTTSTSTGRGEYGARNGSVRLHEPAHEIISLADYRIRHAQYKTDPDLAALHLKLPFITTWDDHESADNAYRDGAENHTPGVGR